MVKINYILFSNYFKGTASSSEINELEEWIKSKEENRRHFNNMNEKWNSNTKKIDTSLVSSDTKVWKKVFSKIKKEDTIF